MSSTHVSLWSTPRNLLKKQKSFMETPELMIGKSQAVNRRVLQKQLSVDQMPRSSGWNINAPTPPYNNNNQPSQNQLQQRTNQETSGLKVVANNLNNHINNNNHRNKRHHLVNQLQPTTTGKNDKVMIKGKDSRININIFLGQASNMHENDNFSDGEDLLFTEQTIHGQQNNNGTSNGKLSAANRRAQFQASRVVETIDTQKAGNRPRASSAPLKALSFDESSKALIVNKANRKLRRRRALREFQECDEDSSNESCDKTRIVKQINLTPSNNGRPRSASSNAGEVETLVSLLSSGGSDSEKEDKEVAPVSQAVVKSDPLPIIKHKPPPLRKIGKSVSFQDDAFEDVTNNNGNTTTIKENPMSTRQNSFNPMPTRARQSRPHNGTLSSNSLFFKELESQSLHLQKLPSSQRDSGNTSPENDSAQESPTSTLAPKTSDEAFPENVQTAKERECYRLYQKMSSMGLNVSFDTVLRGMLTPTELRVIQKKKESELARQATLEREQEAKENENVPKVNGDQK